MKLRPTLVAAVIAVLAGVSTVTLAAAADNAPTAKPEVTAAPQQAETAGKTAAPNKKAKAHSQVFGAQVVEFWLFFAVTSVANCMTVQHCA